jgi:hypothetical protein
MRTTIDLPEDLYEVARSLARDTSQSLSATVAELMRRGLYQVGSEGGPPPGTITRSPLTGLPVIHIGRVITTEDVRSLEDDEP